MTNDTSIARVTAASTQSASTQSASRRRSNTDAIDISQLSFFDELLSIGQFESTLPEPSGLSSQGVAPDRLSQLNNDTSDRDKQDALEDSDHPSEPSASQQQIAVQPLAPTQTPDAGRNTVNEDADSSRQRETAHSPRRISDANAVTVDGTKRNGSNEDDFAAIAVEAPRIDSDVPAVDAAKNIQPNLVESAELKLGGENAEGNPATRSATDEAGNATDRVQTARGAANSTDANSNTGTDDNENAPSRLAQRYSNGQRNTPISSQPQVNTDSNLREAINSLPRNKRAERLAKQATEPDTKQSESNANEELSPLQDASSLEPPVDRNTNDANLSASSSLNGPFPTSSTPIVSVPPISPGTFTLSSGGSAEISRSRSILEVSSANATSAMRASSSTSNTGSPAIGHAAGNATGPGRADNGRSEVARSNSGSQISAYQEAKLVQRVLRGVEQLANGGGQVRLRLHPPELGSLQMSMRMEAGQVFAKLEVENTTARDALLNNVQTLKDRMAEQGMKVASFEVEVSTDSTGSGIANSNSRNGGGSGNESRWENATSRFAQQNSNRIPAEPSPHERKSAPTWTRTNGSLDLTV